MSDTADRRAARSDAYALDHFPTCPHCGNLCGRLASKCADCGAQLYPSHLALQRLEALGSRSMRRARLTALVREDAKAARERERR